MELVDENQVQKALSALKQYLDSNNTAKERSKLFNDNVLQVHFTLKKLPSVIKGHKVIECLLPCSYLDKKVTSICLFTKDIDKQKKRDTDASINHFKELLSDEKGVSCIDEVISFKQLKMEYRTFEARRKLCSAYDIFLVDDNIATLIGPYLGRCFLEEKKMPFPIKLTRGNVNNKIDKCLSTSRLLVNTCSSRCSTKFGSLDQDESDLLNNFRCVLKCVNEKLPGKLENVRSIDINVADCPMLPVYVSIGSANDVKFEPPKAKATNKTIVAPFDSFDKKHLVRITPSGSVKLMKKKKVVTPSKPKTNRSKKFRPIKNLWTKSVKHGKRVVNRAFNHKLEPGNKKKRNEAAAESTKDKKIDAVANKKPKLEVKQEI